MRVCAVLDATFADVRHVVRSLRREKGFTAGAVFTLVLGIAVNLAVFAVVDRVLFRPLPFADSDRLVMISPYSFEHQARFASFTKALFLDGQRLPAIAGMAYGGGFTNNHTFARGGAASAPLGLIEASYNFLDVLGTHPVLGRGFVREDALEARGVAMITYETWVDRFGRAPSILGTELRSGRTVRVVVGVLPAGFQPPIINRPNARFDAVARLAPGVSLSIAQQQFDAPATRSPRALQTGACRAARRGVVLRSE